MLALENADEILLILDQFTKQKSKEIPPELEEYIDYVAKTGDTVYRWPTVQYLFREKLRNVIKDFHDTTASIEDLPQCPNVDQFNYESMKTLLFERFDHFQAAPFTIQRLCELLTSPKKHYTRLDKFMRALEKNILVVSTMEPGRKAVDTEENGDDSLNGDILSGINIGIELNKNILKVDGDTTNVSSDNGNVSVAKKAPVEEVASSSGVSKVEAKSDESVPSKDEPVAKDDEDKKSATVDSEIKPSVDDAKEEVPTKKVEEEQTKEDIDVVKEAKDSTVTESIAEEIKSEVETKVETKAETDAVTDVKMEVEKSVEKVETKSEQTENVVDEPMIATKIDEKSPAKEPVISENPPTPKRLCSDDEDDIVESGERNPKKIKLDSSEADAKTENSPPIGTTNGGEEVKSDTTTEVEKKEELPSKTESTEPVSTDIDAKMESELLKDVVDSVLDAEEEKLKAKGDIDDLAIAAEIMAKKEQLAADSPLVESVAVEKKLDVDAAEIVASKPTTDLEATPTEQNDAKPNDTETNNIAEPVATPVEMTVEETEATVVIPPAVPADAETAMEAVTTKPDEEQMDVDESNSADAMDL